MHYLALDIHNACVMVKGNVTWYTQYRGLNTKSALQDLLTFVFEVGWMCSPGK